MDAAIAIALTTEVHPLAATAILATLIYAAGAMVAQVFRRPE